MKVENCIRTKDGKIGKITYINKDKTAITTDYITNSNIPKCIGVTKIDGKPYSKIVEIARQYIKEQGGFEKFAEWGLY